MAKKYITLVLTQYSIILLFLLFIGSGIVVSPFYGDINLIDEGQFGAWVTHMLQGQHLYKDMYAAYGPFYIYPLYLLAKLFGPSVFLIRIVYIVLNVFFAVIVAQAVIQKLRVAYKLQLFAVFLLLVIPGFGMRQGEGLLTILLVIEAFERKKIGWSILLGINLAIAFLVSSEIGIFSTTIVFLLFCYKSVTEKLGDVIYLKFLACATGIALIFLPFLFWSMTEGWFFDYVHSVITDLSTFSGINLPNGQNFPAVVYSIPNTFSPMIWLKYLLSKQMLLYWLFFFYILVFSSLFVGYVLKQSRKETMSIFILFLFGFFLVTILVGRSGHFPFILSPVIVFFAYFIDRAVKRLRVRQSPAGQLFFFSIIVVIIVFSVRIVSLYRPHFVNVISLPYAIIHRGAGVEYVGPIALSVKQKQSLISIQTFVARNTRPDEPVFFLNNEPMMYLLVNRRNPTRYDFPYIANSKEKRLELLHDLRSAPPRYIFVDTSAWDVDGVSNWQRLPEIVSYAQQFYKKVGNVGDIVVYLRKIQ